MSKEPINLGLYGCGNRTRAILDSLCGEDECRVVAVHDIREEAMQSASEKYGGRLCESADDLVSCNDADAFLISLDPFAHPDAFDRTVEAGKPIFLEKPIAPTAEQAYRMMRKAQEKKVPVHVGFVHRYSPAVRDIMKLLEEHDPGRIFAVNYRWLQNVETEIINMKNTPAADNFRLHISQIPFHCCHALDVLRLIAGEVKSVYAGSRKLMDWDYVTPDEVIAMFEYESGPIGYFHYSGVTIGSTGYSGQIHAENYSVEYVPFCMYEVWHRPQDDSQKQDGTSDCRPHYNKNIVTRKSQGGQWPESPFTDFLTSIREGTPMKAPIEDGYKVAEIADAIRLSYESGEKVELPLCFD